MYVITDEFNITFRFIYLVKLCPAHNRKYQEIIESLISPLSLLKDHITYSLHTRSTEDMTSSIETEVKNFKDWK